MNSAFEFFVTVSIFECALKRAKFLYPEERAKPHWDSFAKEIDDNFYVNISAVPECQILFEKPPKQQIRITDGSLDWKEIPPAKNNAELFLAVRLIRNNLFHGGKYVSGPIEEVSRNEKLLAAGITTLKKAVDVAPERFIIAFQICSENRPEG